MEKTDGGLLTKRKKKGRHKEEEKVSERGRGAVTVGENTSKKCVQTGIREAEK